MTFIEETMKSEKIYEGKIVNLRIDTVELPNKKYSKREVVEHPGGVAMIPIIDENRILLIKQYRKAIEGFIYEIPAGKIELNEEPRETAVRELIEEIGYRPSKLSYLNEFYTSPGFTNEKIYLFLAEDLTPEESTIETDEYIEVEEFSLEELEKMINRNEIIDAKTIIGIYTLKNLLLNK